MTVEDREQRVFFALADPTRRRLLEQLSTGERKSISELARETPLTRQGVSKHLQILAKAGLVRVQKSGRERYYSYEPDSLDGAMAWVVAVNEQWDKRLQALSRYLEEDQTKTDGGGK